MNLFKASGILLVISLLASISVNANATTLSSSKAPSSPWHIDALDNSALKQDGVFREFVNEPQQEISIYIIDTGVNEIEQLNSFHISHIDLTIDAGTDKEGLDCKDHGTSVASSIIGDLGFFKVPSDKLHIFSIKIFSCPEGENQEEYTNVSYLDALKWIWLNHDKSNPGIVNMSISSENKEIEDIARHEAIAQSLINKNLILVAAAANYNTDACNYSPANLKSTITIGALERNSHKPFWGHRQYSNPNPASFSNYGDCVDYWSFGEGISSYNSNGHISQKNGTSLAAPLISGLIATYLAVNPNATISDARASLDVNARYLNMGEEYGFGKVPYYGELISAEAAAHMLPVYNSPELETTLMRFSPSELCIQGNQFIDYGEFIFEIQENNLPVNILKKVSYVDGYSYNTLKLTLTREPINPSVNLYKMINGRKTFITKADYSRG